MNTQRQMSMNAALLVVSTEKMSSGIKINRSGDDPAGFSICEKMRGQIRGLDMASRNTQDGISMIQTAEGSLSEVHGILQRMRELAVQAANDANVAVDRSALDNEFKQLSNEITRISSNTDFNTQILLDGSISGVKLQIGPSSGQIITVSLSVAGVSLSSVTASIATMNLTNQSGASAAITGINTQILAVAAGRSYLGAWQNHFQHTVKDIENSSENLQAAESRIRDVDIAKEVMILSKSNLLHQAGQAMLAQANQAPQGVLQLLR